MTAAEANRLALECGFDLAGVAPAGPVEDYRRYATWTSAGRAGAMSYLEGRRGEMRADPRTLLPSARSVLCLAKVYNSGDGRSAGTGGSEHGWISRYAWGDDYHEWMRARLRELVARLEQAAGKFESKICVDTAPLLERSFARLAGLGWIGRNTCLINQKVGSWVFLGEILLSLPIEPNSPAPDRCGTCRRCIDACPTQAIVPSEDGWTLDARLCISYFTIELRGPIPEDQRSAMGRHVFGCDICQDVCPWNSKAASTSEDGFSARNAEPLLSELAGLTEDEFVRRFRSTPIERTRHSGFLRNVAVAMGNSASRRFEEPLRRLAASHDSNVAQHAAWALEQIEGE